MRVSTRFSTMGCKVDSVSLMLVNWSVIREFYICCSAWRFPATMSVESNRFWMYWKLLLNFSSSRYIGMRFSV